MAGLTREEAAGALETMEATWPAVEIEWLHKLPADELPVFIELAAIGARPVPPEML